MKNSQIFKILFLLSILTTGALASNYYYFHVETPEIADSYFNIFNGIAKIFHSENYLGLLRLVFLFGGFFVFVSGILTSWGQNANGAVSGYVKYLIGGFALLSIVFSKNATMVVKSDTLPTYCSPGSSPTAGFAVDNIPEILAYTFAFTNRFGRDMTRLSEVAYTTPNANGSKSMISSGGYIGALKQTLNLLSININKVSLSNDNGKRAPYDLGAMSRTIFAQCILIPFSARGASGLAQITKLKSSSDIFGYLNNLYSKNPDIGGTKARDFEAKMGGDIWKCGKLWDYVKPYYNKFKTDSVCAVPVGAGAVSIITGTATPPKSTFEQVAIQAGLVGSLAHTASQLGVGIPGMSYASGKTRAEFVQTNMANGEYMAQMLPYLQMTIRAVLYAFLPFVFVIVLLPGGIKVITQYLQSLIWVELWSPTAAILNMFITQESQYKISHEYAKSGGITLTNAISMLSTGSTIAGVAGYLYMSVPALTWLIMKGSAYMLGGIGGAVASGMARNIQTESINKDTSLIKESNAVGAKTGKDISIAEMQHFEAVKNGTVAGAVLGTDMNIGVNDLADTGSFNEASNVANYNSLNTNTGSQGPRKTAQENASARNMNAISLINTNRANGITGKNGSFKLKGQRLLNQNTKKNRGEQNATLAADRSVESYFNQYMNLEANGMTKAKTFQIWSEMNHLTNKEAAITAANVGGIKGATQIAVDKKTEKGLNTWNKTKNINTVAKNIADSNVRNIKTGIAENKALNILGLTSADVGQMKAGQTAKTYQNLERQMKEYGKKSGFGQSWNKKSLAQKLEYYGKHDAITVDYTGSAFGQRISERATTAVTPNGEDVTHTNVDVNGTYSTSLNSLADYYVDTLISRNIVKSTLSDINTVRKGIGSFNLMKKKVDSFFGKNNATEMFHDFKGLGYKGNRRFPGSRPPSGPIVPKQKGPIVPTPKGPTVSTDHYNNVKDYIDTYVIGSLPHKS